ncbi:MAG TPA: hypothetical protein VGL59_06785 [Polyangia bacterium]|jgi:hypothetical protein
MMTKRNLIFGGAFLISVMGLSGACGDTITGTDCKVKCQDVDNTCVQKCTDDQCKTACATDLDHCSASCETITVSPPPKDGG